jgi:hypothetical protein
MKKLLTIVIGGFVVAAIAAPAFAQTQSLADVARKEEERRKEIKKPAKVITNQDLRPGMQPYSQPVPNSTDAAAGDKAKDDKAGGAAGGEKGQAYWQGKKKSLNDALTKDTGYAEALQVRINSLTADFVNRDDPVQKSKIEQDRNKALADLDKLKKDIEADKKAIADLEEEARKAGVPPGWIR